MPGPAGGEQRAGRSARPTIRDVARAAEVSPATAARALSGSGYVAEAARRRVLGAAETLGYVPDATARNLRSRQSDSIGVLVSDLTHPFSAEVAAGASTQARRRGYTVVLSDTGERTDTESEAAEALVALRVAGVVVTAGSVSVLDYLRKQRVPVVEVSRQRTDGAVDAVMVDAREAAYAVTGRLLELGHRRIALLAGADGRRGPGPDHHSGYAQAVEHHGLTVESDLVVTVGRGVEEARKAARALLRGEGRPTAVLVSDEVLAEQVWREAAALGLVLPADLSLASFADAPWMSMVVPGVTAVPQAETRLGEIAVDMLRQRIEDPAAPVRATVRPAQVVFRGSTAPPA